MAAQDSNHDPLHGQTPDYTKYGLEALYDVHRWIDAQRYPERAQAVEREINRQLTLPQYKRAARKPIPIRLFRRAVATAEMIGGTLGIVSVLSTSWSMFAIGNSPQNRTLGIVLGLFGVFVLYAVTVVAGRELFRHRRSGLVLSGAVLGLQAVSFRVFGIVYEVALPASVYVYLPSGEVTFRLNSHWGFGWAQTAAPMFFGINLAVLAMLVLTFASNQPLGQGQRGSSEKPV